MPRYKLQAPLKGWDTTTSLAEQEEGYASLLDNYFPDRQRCTLRKGLLKYAQIETTDAIESLNPYNTAETFIAGAGGALYNVMTGVKIADGFTNNFWRGAEYKGQIFLANGFDDAQVYNGNECKPVEFSGTEDIKFANIAVANNQVIVVAEDSLDFYYLPVGSISGELEQFFLSQIAIKGGKLLAVAAFGKDTANGFNKYVAFITSEGEIIIYNAADFGDPTKIEILGNYFTSRPIGRNCVVQWGADIVIITEDGYKPLSQIVANGELLKESNLFSYRISGAVDEAARKYSEDPRWQGVIAAGENFAMFNVPDDSGNMQHVMNLDTGAWCRFTGIDAQSICVFGGKLYFGMNDGVIAQYSGNSMYDNTYINGHIKNVYSKLGYENYKLLTLFNTRIKSDSPDLEITFAIGADYDDANFEFVQVDNAAGFYWADEDTPETDPDTRYWDEDYWSGGVTDVSRTYSVSGYGISFSLDIKTSTNNTDIEVYDSWVEFEPANALG